MQRKPKHKSYSPFFTRTSFPECERRICLTPTAVALPPPPPPPPPLIWSSGSTILLGDLGDEDNTSAFWAAIFNIALCSSVKNPSFFGDAILFPQSLHQPTNNPHIKRLSSKPTQATKNNPQKGHQFPTSSTRRQKNCRETGEKSTDRSNDSTSIETWLGDVEPRGGGGGEANRKPSRKESLLPAARISTGVRSRRRSGLGVWREKEREMWLYIGRRFQFPVHVRGEIPQRFEEHRRCIYYACEEAMCALGREGSVRGQTACMQGHPLARRPLVRATTCDNERLLTGAAEPVEVAPAGRGDHLLVESAPARMGGHSRVGAPTCGRGNARPQRRPPEGRGGLRAQCSRPGHLRVEAMLANKSGH
ncbi:hypothetical protein BHE74_00012314 [Ensete ventricosum]|nr:hypothetical protein BHE74_00012314 [Ensete ventricosum]